MPNRIIKETICASDNVDALSWFEEVFFYRLLVNCDDYGRMDARAAILRARLFPLKNVTDKQVEQALKSLRSAGIVDLYIVDGKPFLQIRTWEKHQQIRAKKSKYPSPTEHLIANDIRCNQATSNVPVIQYNPIQYESNRENAPAHAKKAYGEFSNVYLTEEEYAALKEKTPDAEARIEEFSAKLKAKGYQYEDHYAAILLWIAQDKEKSKQGKQEVASSFDPDEVLKARLSQTYHDFNELT